MAKTTKTLQLVFLNSANKRSSLSLPDAKDNLDAASVKSAMAMIAASDVFVKEGVELYKVPQSASYIERTVTNLLDDSENTAAKPTQPANPAQVG
ncbi:DUF2922 domain-containing protein [Lactobacillus sp. ESL0785]|uniref:DUF2922 domain-containing protein n=1 Tax=Lactobacillus sp. ESL0785 TaxID=2983232 RepID=UPI0023F6CEC8|nr:DUF2922 domain-containing protein [Lactobacillus sp. ESL0785]WEV70759.1 DUF2922 domain-containing protein [Lactobacillus sp. ESL0785]